jgi:hypothetical protein
MGIHSTHKDSKITSRTPEDKPGRSRTALKEPTAIFSNKENAGITIQTSNSIRQRT